MHDHRGCEGPPTPTFPNPFPHITKLYLSVLTLTLDRYGCVSLKLWFVSEVSWYIGKGVVTLGKIRKRRSLPLETLGFTLQTCRPPVGWISLTECK